MLRVRMFTHSRFASAPINHNANSYRHCSLVANSGEVMVFPDAQEAKWSMAEGVVNKEDKICLSQM